MEYHIQYSSRNPAWRREGAFEFRTPFHLVLGVQGGMYVSNAALMVGGYEERLAVERPGRMYDPH